jgi:enoyl-CoA hydratase/carnithine racemase
MSADVTVDMNDDEVLLEARLGRVAVLTLNRPKAANALSPELIGALNTALEAAELDDDVTAVVITGAGERAFCAGMDLKAFAEHDGGLEISDDAAGMARRYSGAIRPDYPLPIVAAVNGAAVAGGFEMLMGCDLVVAAEHAVFGVAEVKRGLIPGGGGTTLGARLPLALALELVLTGDSINAARAYELGLVNRVVPAADVLDTAVALASTIADNGPLAIQVAKRLVRQGVQAGVEASWPDAATLQEIFGSEDAKEGAIAFIERRPPRFTGR